MREEDPTRIPRVIAALQEAWEGQPDLSLPAFIGMLHTRGMTWATSEDELLQILSDIAEEHPAVIAQPLEGAVLLTTSGPRLAVTLTGETAIVRSADDPQRPPAVWRFASFRPTGPGRPLMVTDTEGVEHRLGVVEMATPLRLEDVLPPEGATPETIRGARWLVLFDDRRRAILGPRLRVWASERRETRVDTVGWRGVEKLAPGEQMQIAPAGGGEPLLLGLVEAVYLIEA